MWIALLPFMNLITAATDTFGGIKMSIAEALVTAPGRVLQIVEQLRELKG